jgi:hypothetical protein
MKKCTLFLITFFVNFPIFAMEPLPLNLIPLLNEVTVRYTPTHQAVCTTKTSEKKTTEFFGKNTTIKSIFTLSKDFAQKLNYTFNGDIDGVSIDMSFEINNDGSGLVDIAPKIKINKIRENNEKLDIDTLKTLLAPILATTLRKTISPIIGKSIHQSSAVEYDFCKVFNTLPYSTMLSSDEDLSVKGTALINGRDNIIYAGKTSCKARVSGSDLVSEITSWYAIDKISGLESERHSNSIVILDGVITTSDESKLCIISGVSSLQSEASLQNTNTTPISMNNISVTQKLTELKVLLDKNLITKEMFDKKRIEIMKAF